MANKLGQHEYFVSDMRSLVQLLDKKYLPQFGRYWIKWLFVGEDFNQITPLQQMFMKLELIKWEQSMSSMMTNRKSFTTSKDSKVFW